MLPFKPAETVLRELGITAPEDIDIEAIACYCGALVRYRALDGCAARIIGLGDRAIISVDASERIRGRQRFSVAHEIGHWMRDRGKAAFCQEEDFRRFWGDDYRLNPESLANEYAADLLLPSYLFKPSAKARPVTFDTVRELADKFSTSYTATALRLVQFGLPAIVACYEMTGRCWYKAGPDVPYFLRPAREVPHETAAFDLLFGGTEYRRPVLADAADWIDHRSSARYSISEHGIKIANDTILVLLWWKDESQISDLA